MFALKKIPTVMLVTALALPALALAQQDDVTQREMQRSSIERDQQSEAFALQLRQQQQLNQAPAAARSALEAEQLRQRQAFDNLAERQRTELRIAPAGAGDGPSWGPRLELERRTLSQQGRAQ